MSVRFATVFSVFCATSCAYVNEQHDDREFILRRSPYAFLQSAHDLVKYGDLKSVAEAEEFLDADLALQDRVEAPGIQHLEYRVELGDYKVSEDDISVMFSARTQTGSSVSTSTTVLKQQESGQVIVHNLSSWMCVQSADVVSIAGAGLEVRHDPPGTDSLTIVNPRSRFAPFTSFYFARGYPCAQGFSAIQLRSDQIADVLKGENGRMRHVQHRSLGSYYQREDVCMRFGISTTASCS